MRSRHDGNIVRATQEPDGVLFGKFSAATVAGSTTRESAWLHSDHGDRELRQRAQAATYRGEPVGHGVLVKPQDCTTRILVAVTGLSPQIVTETLYALAVAPAASEPSFVPTTIRLITTKEGGSRAKDSLLTPRSGWFHRLRSDYHLPSIEFGPEHIVVLEDRNGQPLDDIRTRDDNERAADAITEQIRELTRDDDSALHVSIAGGRKTMGFYLGYALSLYGRAQDRLSHVLVSAPYESHAEFFYPAPQPRIIHDRDGRQYDAHDARVTLAEIPFVRMRSGLGRELLDGSASFSSVVEEAQRALPPVGLVLDPSRCAVTAGGATFDLRPSKFALYWLLAERARRGCPAAHWSEDKFMTQLLDYYGRIEMTGPGEYDRIETAYEGRRGDKIVNPAKAHINRILRQRLGVRRAAPYLIASLAQIPTTRSKRFGLRLPPNAIRIRGATNCEYNVNDIDAVVPGAPSAARARRGNDP